MTGPPVAGTCGEPVIRLLLVDMTTTAERSIVTRGETVYSIFVDLLGAGTTSFEIKINDQWIPLQQNDTVFLGDEHPTVNGLLVRTQPALAGIFSRLIIGGTPDGALVRG